MKIERIPAAKLTPGNRAAFVHNSGVKVWMMVTEGFKGGRFAVDNTQTFEDGTSVPGQRFIPCEETTEFDVLYL